MGTKYLRKITDGTLYVYTDALAKRNDMVPVLGDPFAAPEDSPPSEPTEVKVDPEIGPTEEPIVPRKRLKRA